MPGFVLVPVLVLVVSGCLRKPPSGTATALHEAAKLGDLAEVTSLVAGGAELNVQDPNAWTPLHYAAANGHKGVAALLLDLGAAVNARATSGERGPDGAMPLHEAAKGGHASVAELLIAHGAGAAVGVIAAGLCFYLLSVWRNPGALARKLEAATSTTFVGDAKP